MRAPAFCRVLALAALATALVPAQSRAQANATVLGADGEVYRAQSGSYRSLFPDAPASQADNPVLAIDISRDGQVQRLLVPGTDGPEAEQSPAITVDHATNSVYLVWEGRRGIHSVLDLIGYSSSGFGEVFEFSGDVFSFKTNPQLSTTLDHYQILGADGEPVSAVRVILHLVWFDDGGLGQRVLYTPLVIEDGNVLHTNRIFDLQELASGEPATGAANAAAPPALLQKPQAHSGRDGQSVVVSFVEPSTGRLAALELRSVTGELVSFADKARAQVIEIGRANPELSRPAIVNKARAQVIEIGRKLMRKDVADYLAGSFLTGIVDGDTEESLEDVTEEARAQVIEIGVSLRRGVADKARAQVIEIGHSQGDDDGTSHLLDLRKASRRELPELPADPLRVFLSPKGNDAALAWTVDGTVRYRESTGDGEWSPVRTLTLGPTLSSDDAYKLVEQRLSLK